MKQNFLFAIKTAAFGLTVFLLPSLPGSITAAQAKMITGLSGNVDHLKIVQIRKAVKLIENKKTIRHCNGNDCLDRESDLLVNAIVVDNGPSTDVSPPQSIYLTIYNSIEETGTGSSIHHIDDIYEFGTASRIGPGIYEVRYRAFRPGEACVAPNILATIDARALSIKVRAGQEVPEFEDHIYTDPIQVTYSQLSCPPLE